MSKDDNAHAMGNAKAWLGSIEEMLADLEKAQDADGDRASNSLEDAERAIHESVLSVSVRDGWRQPGTVSEEGAIEYEILLSTGGPALRIWGELNQHDEPHTAVLQWQDWGTPWTRYPAPEATLLRFARCFYFGG